MPASRIAYMPLIASPVNITDEGIRQCASMISSFGCAISVTTFAEEIPRTTMGLGDYLVNVPDLVRTANEKCTVECHRLESVIRGAFCPHDIINISMRKIAWGSAPTAAAAEARYFDLTLIPWSSDVGEEQHLAQSIIFGSGRPVILIPSKVPSSTLDHLAIAWDGSRVAARALGDVLPYLSEPRQVSVLTVRGEKDLGSSNVGEKLASWLKKRRFESTPVEIALDGRPISTALQDAALSRGAKLLAMGGFGHSRFRDFVLGGATKQILSHTRIPVLISH